MSDIETDEAEDIFREECKKIIVAFEKDIIFYEQTQNKDFLVKLMREAHAIKGAAAIVGLKQVQTLAHNIEDLLGKIQDGSSDIEGKNILSEIKGLISETDELVHCQKVMLKTTEEIIKELIYKIPLLKEDIKLAPELTDLSLTLCNQADIAKNTIISDTVQCIYKILEKVKLSKKIKDKSLLNILVGGLKSIKRIICDKTTNTDEIILVKHKMNIALQMIDVYVDYSQRDTEQNKDSNNNILANFSDKKPDVKNIFSDYTHNSIKTLRIESDKLDGISQCLDELGELSINTRKEYNKAAGIIEKIYSKAAEAENIINEKGTCEIIQRFKEIKELTEELNLFSKKRLEVNKKFINEYVKLTESIQNIRNLKLGVILHMFPRMVRDIVQEENKEAEIEITGGEVSIDKNILEEIKNPLIHLLRNAVDHGIEKPEIRESIGKTRAGKIIIKAVKKRGKVIISVKDDGQGIDIDKVKEKAIEQHFIQKEEINSLKRKDYLKLVLQPGFSTVDQVSEISGRGMGLDIVNTKIKNIGGKISIDTKKGIGTEIILECPTVFFGQNIQKKQNNDKNPKIAVIDDSKIAKNYIKKIVKGTGYDVLAYDSAKKSLRKLEEKNIKLIISDIEMPDMNGAEFVKYIKKKEKMKNIPIIIISMLSIDRVSELFRGIKIEAFLSKSELNKNNLVTTIKEILTTE